MKRIFLNVEELEPRDVPSAAPTHTVLPFKHHRMRHSPPRHHNHKVPLVPPPPDAFGSLTPAEQRSWYGFNRVPETGAGQTVAIVDAFTDPTLGRDLAIYDKAFRLPAVNISVVQPEGTPGFDVTNSWRTEIVLDVEEVHAVAPGARILLVEAADASDASLYPAVQYAAAQPGVSVVSMSWGRLEQPNDPALQSFFAQPANHNPVTFVAAAGDQPGTEFPSTSPGVLAVGGTFVLGGFKGDPTHEINDPFDGGGRSLEFPDRVTPDVSASSVTLIYSTEFGRGAQGWSYVEGTSVSAPLWAGLISLLDQRHGLADYTPLIRSAPQQDFRSVPNPDGSVPTNEGRGVPVVPNLLNDL